MRPCDAGMMLGYFRFQSAYCTPVGKVLFVSRNEQVAILHTLPACFFLFVFLSLP